jgi:hypothetical protein
LWKIKKSKGCSIKTKKVETNWPKKRRGIKTVTVKKNRGIIKKSKIVKVQVISAKKKALKVMGIKISGIK